MVAITLHASDCFSRTCSSNTGKAATCKCGGDDIFIKKILCITSQCKVLYSYMHAAIAHSCMSKLSEGTYLYGVNSLRKYMSPLDWNYWWWWCLIFWCHILMPYNTYMYNVSASLAGKFRSSCKSKLAMVEPH